MARFGNNITETKKLRVAQCKYILENMTEPNFYNDQKIANYTLGEEFDIAEEPDTFDTLAISYRLLNHQGFGQSSHGEPTWYSVAMFMDSIQSYLPKSVQPCRHYRLWYPMNYTGEQANRVSKELAQVLDEMVVWLKNMKNMIEDFMTKQYFVHGKYNHLEILKRRFKDNWSEKVEQAINADVKQDNEIQIVFEDA